MESKNNVIIIGLLALILGLILGYFFGTGRSCSMMKETGSQSHMMGGTHEMGGMDDMMADMTTRLQGKTGMEFEKAFIEDMIVHHEGAVDMAEMLLERTSRPELTKLGNDIITAQTKEIEIMKEWRRMWFR